MKLVQVKRKRYYMMMTASLFLMLIISSMMQKSTKAAEIITVKEINYQKSTITLQLNSGDTEVYFSDSKKQDWVQVPGEITSTNTITMDISWVSTSRNYIITFKGNKSTGIISVTIPKQATNFKATYNKSSGMVTFRNVGGRTIEWRKKDSTKWNTVNTNTLASDLSKFNNNGATIYFRLAPMNGTSVTNIGFRPSKEVSITIAKKATAPSVVINGSKLSIAVKKGMSYRTVESDGSTSQWLNIGSTTNLLLEKIAPSALYVNGSSPHASVTLQFRTNSTSSTQVSKITTITVPIQEGAPDPDLYGISISNASSTTVSLQVKAATAKVPFEYTIVKKDDELNYQNANWTSITSSEAVILDYKKAPAGSHIFVRKKSIAASESEDFSLASAVTDITEDGLVYLNAPKATTLTTLISTAGVCKSSNSSSSLSFVLYSPTSTTVSSINFRNLYGVNRGAVTSMSTVVRNTSSTGLEDKYIITTKITSTANVDAFTEEILYADITLSNSDVITSSPTTGVLLYLYPRTTVNNPIGDDKYNTDFKRVYLSNEQKDASSFKFQLDLGTAKLIDTTEVGKYKTEDVSISSIKYDGYTLIKDKDYTVEYGSYKDDDDLTKATATVTVNVKEFEASSAIDTTDKALPLVIKLNNEEVIDSDVKLTLISTATIDKTPIAWSITEGSLKETKTSTIINEDKSQTTVTEEVITYTITLTLFDSNYDVGVSDVTWGGTSVFGSAMISEGKATIYLSNAKINKLDTASTDTKNFVITLSNGYVIRSGCKLTILNAMN